MHHNGAGRWERGERMGGGSSQVGVGRKNGRGVFTGESGEKEWEGVITNDALKFTKTIEFQNSEIVIFSLKFVQSSMEKQIFNFYEITCFFL